MLPPAHRGPPSPPRGPHTRLRSPLHRVPRPRKPGSPAHSHCVPPTVASLCGGPKNDGGHFRAGFATPKSILSLHLSVAASVHENGGDPKQDAISLHISDVGGGSFLNPSFLCRDFTYLRGNQRTTPIFRRIPPSVCPNIQPMEFHKTLLVRKLSHILLFKKNPDQLLRKDMIGRAETRSFFPSLYIIGAGKQAPI